MLSEQSIRIIFAIIFLALFSVGFTFRIKAHRQKDRFERIKHEGATTFLILRLCGGVLWLSAILFPVAPDWFSAVRFESSAVSQLTGIILACLSIPMGFSVFTNLGKNITDTVETRKDHQLVTTGIYQYIRHPLYTTGLLFFIGLGLLSSNWLLLFLSSIVAMTLYVRTFTEEQKLLEEFGDRYRQYIAVTGKFFPKLFHH